MLKYLKGSALFMAMIFAPLTTFAFPDFNHKSDMEKFLFAAFKGSLNLFDSAIPAVNEKIEFHDGRTYLVHFSENSRNIYKSVEGTVVPFSEFGEILAGLVALTKALGGTIPQDITYKQFKVFLDLAEDTYEGKTRTLEKSISTLLKGTGFNQTDAKTMLTNNGVTFVDTEEGIIKGLSQIPATTDIIAAMKNAAQALKKEKKLGHKVYDILLGVLHGQNEGTVLKTGLPFGQGRVYIQNYSFKVPASNISAFSLLDRGIDPIKK